MEAIHFGYLMLSSDGIPAGVLFNWMLYTSDGRVYSLDTADYPRFPLFTGSGHAANAGTTAFSNPEFGSCLTSLLSSVRGGYIATVLFD